MKLDPDDIRARLRNQPAATSPSSVPPSLQAAVLVLLCPGASSPVTFLTLRSDQLPQHAGQISFPGGRVQPDDASLEATALREAMEETGLAVAGLEVLGRLPVTVVPSSGFEITPVVAWLDAAPRFEPDPREVAAMIECPLSVALDPDAYMTGSLVRDGVTREFWYIDFDGHHVWGATARILRSLALILGEDGNQPALR